MSQNPYLTAIDGLSAPPSLVKPRRDTLIGGVMVSVVLHVWVASTALCIGVMWEPAQAPIRPDEAMEVSMMVLPRAARMPDKAMHTPRSGSTAPQTQTGAAPERTPTPPAEADPSDLAYQDPNKKPDPKSAKSDQAREDLTRKREEALRRMMMEDALADLDSPEGPRDRQATDPNSTSDELIDLGGRGSAADPEIVKHLQAVKRLFEANFRPLRTITSANPGLRCRVRVLVDVETGAVLSYEVIAGSGNDSYDRAAESAAAAVPKVPLPPAQFKEKAKEGYIIEFKPPS